MRIGALMATDALPDHRLGHLKSKHQVGRGPSIQIFRAIATLVLRSKSPLRRGCVERAGSRAVPAFSASEVDINGMVLVGMANQYARRSG